MTKIGRVKKSVPLFLIVGIFVLCVGFFIVSCGSGISPQMKVATINAGPNAIDMSDCPAAALGPCYVIIESDVFDTVSSKFMAGKELTAEAWVKIHSASTSGAIFGRMDSGGIFLYVKDGYPVVVVRRALQPTGTVDLIVSSPSSSPSLLVPNEWTHIAGVLTHSSNSTSTLSLYIDGQAVANGAGVASALYTEPASNLMVAGAFGDGPVIAGVSGSTLNGTVDETRLWGVARTQSEIQACMGEELGLNSGTCGRMTDDLIGYFRFNEGSGHGVSEWSGLGSAFKEYFDPLSTNDPKIEHWVTGWTAGAPISAKD